MLKIAVTIPAGAMRDSFIPSDVAEAIESMGHTIWNKLKQNYDADGLREAIREADVCITGWGCSRFDSEVLKTGEKLRLIAHTGGSVASIVSNELYDRGIKVISGNRLYAESVAEGVIGYILASLRNIPLFHNCVQVDGWIGKDARNEGLLDQTCGLVGFGAAARYLVEMLKVFRVKVRVYDPFVSDEICAEYGVERVNSLEDLFISSKILSIHASGTPQTHHLINRRLLALIPDGVLFINTARGSIVDEEALADVLRQGRFKAVLDVYEFEPLPRESRLRGLENVILMPHMAGPTVDRHKIVTLELLKDIRRYFAGQPLQFEISRDYAMGMTG